MEFERHCALIVEQAEMLAGHLTSGSDDRTEVGGDKGLLDYYRERVSFG